MTKALKLFKNKLCPYCQRVAIVAKVKKIDMEEVEVPLGDEMPQWYKEINPRETVPTLQVDKKFVFESDLIARYLDAISSPANSLQGSTNYERHRVEFFLSQVGDLIGAYFSLIKDPFNAEKRKFVDDNSEYIEGIIAEQQQHDGPYYLDDKISLADIMVIPFLARFKPSLGYYAAYDIFNKAPRLKKMYIAAIQLSSVKETLLKPEEYITICKKYVPSTHITLSMSPGNVLFVNRGCPFADRALLACAIKNINIPYIDVDLRNLPSWYPWVNFRETVPTLLTTEGTYVHESLPIVHYIDEAYSQNGPHLLPKDADHMYFVRFVESNVGHFVGAMFGIYQNPKDKESKEDLEWAAGELEKQLKEQQFGSGPFFGGAEMNVADIALLPMLVRLKACTPGLTDGYDLFAKYKLLTAHVEAGLASEVGKKVFRPLEEYFQAYKTKFRPSS